MVDRFYEIIFVLFAARTDVFGITLRRTSRFDNRNRILVFVFFTATACEKRGG